MARPSSPQRLYARAGACTSISSQPVHCSPHRHEYIDPRGLCSARRCRSRRVSASDGYAYRFSTRRERRSNIVRDIGPRDVDRRGHDTQHFGGEHHHHPSAPRPAPRDIPCGPGFEKPAPPFKAFLLIGPVTTAEQAQEFTSSTARAITRITGLRVARILASRARRVPERRVGRIGRPLAAAKAASRGSWRCESGVPDGKCPGVAEIDSNGRRAPSFHHAAAASSGPIPAGGAQVRTIGARGCRRLLFPANADVGL